MHRRAVRLGVVVCEAADPPEGLLDVLRLAEVLRVEALHLFGEDRLLYVPLLGVVHLRHEAVELRGRRREPEGAQDLLLY